MHSSQPHWSTPLLCKALESSLRAEKLLLSFFVGLNTWSIFKEIKHLNLTLVINPTHYSNGFMSGVNKAIKILKCLNALAVMCWTKKVFSWFLWIRRADLEVNLWVTRWKENLGFNHLWDKNAHFEPFLCLERLNNLRWKIFFIPNSSMTRDKHGLTPFHC